MNLLDDLGLDLDDLDGPLLATAPDISEPEWVGPPHLRPHRMRVGDWYARALDAGLPYDLLVENATRFAFHQAPASDADLPSRRRGQTRRPEADSGRPMHAAIALTRADDETDREYLLRIGRQVQVFDLPDARPFFGGPWHQSAFDGCDLVAADMTFLVDSPFTVDRMALVVRMSTSTEALDRLSFDAAVGVRIGVGSHSAIDVRTAVRLLGDDHTDVYAAVMTNPAVDDTAKEAAARERSGVDLLTAKRVLSITHPVSSVSLVSARP